MYLFFFFVLNILSFRIKIGLRGFEWNSKRFTDIPKNAESQQQNPLKMSGVDSKTCHNAKTDLWLGNYSENCLSNQWFVVNIVVDFLKKNNSLKNLLKLYSAKQPVEFLRKVKHLTNLHKKLYSHFMSNLLFELKSIINHFDKVGKCWLQHNSSCINVQPICKVFETYLS